MAGFGPRSTSDEFDFSTHRGPIAVEGGIRAQSTRGAIGESWWSKRFITVLESFPIATRLARGRAYARKGQVLSLTVTAGLVRASVQGSRPEPYSVAIGLPVLTPATWQVVETRLAGQALFVARLLSGEMPAAIEQVFAEAGAPLFPTTSSQLTMECSCPDASVPCKHIAATFYLLAESFDADPFQILAWRGRDRSTLLSRLRRLRDTGPVDSDGADEVDDATDLDDRVDDATRGGGRVGTRTTGRRTRAESVNGSGPRTAPRASITGGTRRVKIVGRDSGAEPGGRNQGTETGSGGPEPAPVGIGAASVLTDVPSPDLAETVQRFWVAPVPLPARPATVDTSTDLLLRQLGAPPAKLGGTELRRELQRHYEALRPASV
jgi:uncharacterized Zn finger protein